MSIRRDKMYWFRILYAHGMDLTSIVNLLDCTCLSVYPPIHSQQQWIYPSVCPSVHAFLLAINMLLDVMFSPLISIYTSSQLVYAHSIYMNSRDCLDYTFTIFSLTHSTLCSLLLVDIRLQGQALHDLLRYNDSRSGQSALCALIRAWGSPCFIDLHCQRLG
jgi:hypothetical protein